MIFLLADLPNGVALPVHMFDWRFNQSMRNWILVPVLLLTLYWLYRYFKNMQKDIPKRKQRVPSQPPNVLREKIEVIQRNYSSNFMYRDGLHELSALMKTHFESKTGLDIEEMTAPEIARKIKDKTVIGFFYNLADLQFGKNNPMKSEFDEIFTTAKIASGVEKASKAKTKNAEIVRPNS